MSYLTEIKAMIATTNNGKLMLERIPQPARAAVPKLIELGYLKRATFLYPGDAVKEA